MQQIYHEEQRFWSDNSRLLFFTRGIQCQLCSLCDLIFSREPPYTLADKSKYLKVWISDEHLSFWDLSKWALFLQLFSAYISSHDKKWKVRYI